MTKTNIIQSLRQSLVHTNNFAICRSDVVDILRIVDAEWNEAQTAESRPTKRKTDDGTQYICQYPSPILKYSLHLFT